MSQKHYFIGMVEVYDKDKLCLALGKALISKNGVFNLSGESEFFQRSFLSAKVFRILIDESYAYQGRLVREQGADGLRFNINLVNFQPTHDDYLTESILRRGIESPWRRDFPRIPVSTQSTLGIPKEVRFSRLLNLSTCKVVNYSLNGMQFEFQCAGPGRGETIGQRIEFQLLSGSGEKVGPIEARIVRIHDEMIGALKMRRRLGVKFINFRGDSLDKYQCIILDACESLNAIRELELEKRKS